VASQSVTQVLLLLCGPAGRDMNGAILPIDGGWLAS
jgi:3-hydroxybutyrate dehydrogenase